MNALHRRGYDRVPHVCDETQRAAGLSGLCSGVVASGTRATSGIRKWNAKTIDCFRLCAVFLSLVLGNQVRFGSAAGGERHLSTFLVIELRALGMCVAAFHSSPKCTVS